MNNSNKPNKPANGLPPLMEGIRDVLEGVNELKERVIQSQQDTLEAYLDGKSKEIDNSILSVEKSGIGVYAAGEISAILDPDDMFHIEGDFYFKNNKGEWIKKSLKGKSIRLDWALLPDEQDKLRILKKITFDYNRPQ